MSGLHRGAALPLVGDSWIIGADESADLVLFDPGIKARHIVLERADGWLLKAHEGAVRDASGAPLEVGRSVAGDDPFSVACIWLCVMDAESPWPEESAMDKLEQHGRESLQHAGDTPSTNTSSSWSVASLLSEWRLTQPRWMVRLATGIVIATIATTVWGVVNHGPGVDEPSDVANGQSQRRLSESDVQQHLRSMLSKRELGQRVQVVQRSDAIVLSGDVSKEQMGVIQRMLDTFHQHYRTPKPIKNDVSPLSDQLPFKVRQIVGGATPQIVLTDGRRLFVGDEANGLVLTSMKGRTLSFQGATRKYEVHW